jgi:hypothetical protein
MNHRGISLIGDQQDRGNGDPVFPEQLNGALPSLQKTTVQIKRLPFEKHFFEIRAADDPEIKALRTTLIVACDNPSSKIS